MTGTPPAQGTQSTSSDRFICNIEGYLSYTEEFDLDESERAELVQTLWNIMLRLVGIEFGVDPTQILVGKADMVDAKKPADMVCSDRSET